MTLHFIIGPLFLLLVKIRGRDVCLCSEYAHVTVDFKVLCAYKQYFRYFHQMLSVKNMSTFHSKIKTLYCMKELKPIFVVG